MNIKTDMPLVTVALPVFNAGRFLRPAVKSILRQTYVNWELLLIDDSSTDKSIATINSIRDSRVKIIQGGQNLGLAARLNQAIDMAQGKLFARMDQDDIAYPDRLSRQVDTLQRNSGLDLVAVRALAISAEDEPMGLMPYLETHEELCAKIWKGFYLAHPTWMGRMAWFRKYRYKLPAPYLCEDQELLLRSYKDSRFYALPETLSAYRLRSNIALRKALRTRFSMLAFQSHYFLRAGQVQLIPLSFGVFIGRIMLDTIGVAIGGHRLFQMRFNVPASTEEKQRWLEVRHSLD